MESQTFLEFVMEQPNVKKLNDISYSFWYNGIACHGLVTKLPHTELLQIFPCNGNEDVGTGVKGTPLTKEFKRIN